MLQVRLFHNLPLANPRSLSHLFAELQKQPTKSLIALELTELVIRQGCADDDLTQPRQHAQWIDV